jgi:hypothetical protein
MKDLQKEFIPYELALRMKSLGFDEPCFNKFYTKPNSKMFGIDDKGRHYPIKNTAKKLYTIGEHFVLKDDNVILAPLYQQVFRWFREKHGLSKTIDDFYSDGKLRFDYSIRKIGSQEDNPKGIFVSYEDAQQACLEEMIQIIEQDGKNKSET